MSFATTSAPVSFPKIDAVVNAALDGTLPVSVTPTKPQPLPDHVTTAVNSLTIDARNVETLTLAARELKTTPYTLQAIINYMTAENAPEEDPNDPATVAAFVEAWTASDDPNRTAYTEDYDAWSASAVADNETNTAALADDVRALNDTAVADIVALIRAKYEDEALRSFAIGKRAFEHAQWQKKNFPGEYQKGDFTALMNRLRDDVRMMIYIKDGSIRVADWTRAYVLRELIRGEAGDTTADALSMFEYLAITPKALEFDTAALTGTIRPAWLDFARNVSAIRATGKRFSSKEFDAGIKETETRAKQMKTAALDPVAAAKQASREAIKKSTAKIANDTKKIANALNDALTEGTITPAGALGILEGIANSHGTPLETNAVGFNPATATVEDANALVATMFAAGKVVEMRAMHAALSRHLAVIDAALSRRAIVDTKTAAPVAEPVAA